MNFKALYEDSVGQISNFASEYPWQNKDAYAWFLSQTYFYTRHSTKLLTLAASRFDWSDYDLHRRFIVHSQEERGHEFMCEKDLSVLGYKIADFKELTSTAAFYQRQYYLIEHVDPVAFLGYVLCLEGLSAKAAGVTRHKIKDHYGDKTALFLRAHSDEDPDHIDKAFKALDSLTAPRMQIVADNMLMSCDLYAEMLSEMRDIVTKGSAKKKAA